MSNFVKFVSPGGWDFDRPVAIPIQVSSRGLIGNDRAQFLKTASHVFADMLDNVKIARDEVPMHLIALGASEAYGPNRNGDGFSEHECISRCNTFTKLGFYFRNHKNKPEKGHPKYGIIKLAAYNRPMRRVELLVALNAEKSAAERNGGLVADRECEKLARGEDLDVSMACSVPFDECSWCGNRARHRDEYCTHEKCAAGGCAERLAQLVKVGDDWHHLHVKNYQPSWFDISGVIRRADRIALGAAPDYLTKAASLNSGIYDDSLPVNVRDYLQLGPETTDETVEWQVKLASGLALLEQSESDVPLAFKLAFHEDVQRPFDISWLGNPGTEKLAVSLRALADRKIILPWRDFAKLAGQDQLAESGRAVLRHAFSDWQRSLTRDELLTNRFGVSNKLASAEVRRAADGCLDWSLDLDRIGRRSVLGSLRGVAPRQTVLSKSAADSERCWPLVKQYLAYETAALQHIAGFDNQFPLTARLAVCQNLSV